MRIVRQIYAIRDAARKTRQYFCKRKVANPSKLSYSKKVVKELFCISEKITRVCVHDAISKLTKGLTKEDIYMTDFDKIKAYYSVFDEQHRLDAAEGRLEFDISKSIILEYLNKSDRILDLGGGAGRYSIELAKQGYDVTLADLSERLLEQAKTYVEENNILPLKGYDVVNAVDLSRYEDNSFDAVILFGPLYHLLDGDERNRCVSEVYRVLKPNGIVFASFIPYLAGAVGIVTRAFLFPQQVDEHNLSEVFETGRFHNNANVAFQEGYYPEPKEIIKLFGEHSFSQILLRSIRSFGYNKEEKLYELYKKDISLFNKMIELINKTSTNPALIETCGHALYIGRRC